MSNYEELSIERKRLQEEGLLPEWYQTAGYQLLKDKYLWGDSNLKETFQRMADTAIRHLKGKLPQDEVDYLHKRFFEVLWDGDLAAASPVYNLGTPRGLPVSCSGGYIKDEVIGFYDHRREVAVLTQKQFGTSGYLGAIRPRGSKISSGGTAAGLVPVFNGVAQDMIDVTQGTLRRGSYGGYVPVGHGDFHELISSIMAEPEGKNLGINYHDEDVKAVLSNDAENDIFKRWQKHMKLRAVFGKGYFYFPDRVARLQPKMYQDQKEFVFEYKKDEFVQFYHDYRFKFRDVKDIVELFKKGDLVRIPTSTLTLLTIYDIEETDTKFIIKTKRILKSWASNLCTEITLHADELHTYACVLSSMNASRFDKWKDTDAVYVSTIFLDCVNQELIELAKEIPGMEAVVRGAEKGRPLGLGLLGFHTYLQENMIAFESVEAMDANMEIFTHLHDEAKRASQYMAKVLGEPEWCEGYGVRNTHLTAIAPNMSSSILVGGTSQGIEPIFSNTYQQKMAGGTVTRINPTLLRLMRERGVYCQELVDKISMEFNGSVQDASIDWLTPHEKLVFKTAYEIDQFTIIDLACERQPKVCQAQSINTFFKGDADEQYIADVTQYGMSRKFCKSLYYQRSESKIKGSNGKATNFKAGGASAEVECVACEA